MHNKKRFRFFSLPMIFLYLFVGIALLTYLGLTFYFQEHYFPNTTVGSIECGMKTADYVEKENEALVSRYSILITDRKESLFVLAGNTFDYAYVNQGEEQTILKSQNAFAWPLEVFEEHKYTLTYSATYDESKLIAEINKLPLFKEDYIEQPVDASIELNETGYTIIPEIMGNVPIAEKVQEEITKAVSESATTLTLSNACYATPSLYSSAEEIISVANTIDNYLKSTITYDIEGVDETFSKEMIMAMIQLKDNYEITLDTTIVDKYVQKLASTYNTYGDTREFTTAKGDVVKIGGGDYGWVINKQKEAAQILADLAGGTPVTREPIYEQRAAAFGPNDYGDTYIEVDYTNQHLWFFKEGELAMESDFVSGSMSEGNGSPDGIFDVNYKVRDAVLRGEDYESNVDFFVVFAYNVGFHDASWREPEEFGGITYLDDGSHGCINMPHDSAEVLYDIVSNGTPIIAYYREPVELNAYNCKISNAYSYKEPTLELPEEGETQDPTENTDNTTTP